MVIFSSNEINPLLSEGFKKALTNDTVNLNDAGFLFS